MPWRPGVDRGRSSAETPRAIFGGSSWARSEIGDGRACAAVSIDPGPPGDGPLPASLCIIRRSLAARTLPNTRPAHSPEELRSARQNRCRLRAGHPREMMRNCVSLGRLVVLPQRKLHPSIFNLQSSASRLVSRPLWCSAGLRLRPRDSAALRNLALWRVCRPVFDSPVDGNRDEILRGRSAGERRYGAGCSRRSHGQR